MSGSEVEVSVDEGKSDEVSSPELVSVGFGLQADITSKKLKTKGNALMILVFLFLLINVFVFKKARQN